MIVIKDMIKFDRFIDWAHLKVQRQNDLIISSSQQK